MADGLRERGKGDVCMMLPFLKKFFLTLQLFFFEVIRGFPYISF